MARQYVKIQQLVSRLPRNYPTHARPEPLRLNIVLYSLHQVCQLVLLLD